MFCTYGRSHVEPHVDLVAVARGPGAIAAPWSQRRFAAKIATARRAAVALAIVLGSTRVPIRVAGTKNGYLYPTEKGGVMGDVVKMRDPSEPRHGNNESPSKSKTSLHFTKRTTLRSPLRLSSATAVTKS